MITKEDYCKTLKLIRASRVKANANIVGSLELTRKLEESLDRYVSLLHCNNADIADCVSKLNKLLEEEYDYNQREIRNIDNYLRYGKFADDNYSVNEWLMKLIKEINQI